MSSPVDAILASLLASITPLVSSVETVALNIITGFIGLGIAVWAASKVYHQFTGAEPVHTGLSDADYLVVHHGLTREQSYEITGDEPSDAAYERAPLTDENWAAVKASVEGDADELDDDDLAALHYDVTGIDPEEIDYYDEMERDEIHNG